MVLNMIQEMGFKDKFLFEDLRTLGSLIDNLSKYALNVERSKYVLFTIRDALDLIKSDLDRVDANVIIRSVIEFLDNRINALAQILSDDDYHATNDGFELISSSLVTFSNVIYKALCELEHGPYGLNDDNQDEEQNEEQNVEQDEEPMDEE